MVLLFQTSVHLLFILKTPLVAVRDNLCEKKKGGERKGRDKENARQQQQKKARITCASDDGAKTTAITKRTE
jgi:hypothetical protein